MDVMGVFGTLRKRWFLALPLLALTLAATAALWARPGPYQSESQVVLLPSEKISKPNGDNPYLSFVDSITLTADLVRREMIDPRTVQTLADHGFLSSYQVVDDPATAGPVLDITATGKNKTSVEQTLRAATAEISTKLASMQAGVKQSSQITSEVVSLDPHATLMISKKARTVVVALGIGIVLMLAIPQIADANLTRRRQRRGVMASRRKRPAELSEDDPFESSDGRTASEGRRVRASAGRDAEEYAQAGHPSDAR